MAYPTQHPSTLLISTMVLQISCTAKLFVTEENAVMSAQEGGLAWMVKNPDEWIFKTGACLSHAAASLARRSGQLPAKV